MKEHVLIATILSVLCAAFAPKPATATVPSAKADTPIASTTPSATAPAAPQAPAAARAPTAPPAPSEPMRLPPPPKSGEQWQAGLHYSVLLGKAATQVAPGKVEVRELFMYTSPLSYEIQSYLKEWLKRKADYVEYVRSPSIVFPHARLQARMYFTLQQLGREDLHDALFAWVFQKEHYRIYHTIQHPDEAGYMRLNLEFASANGLDKNRFAEIYGSKALEDEVIKAEIDTHGYLVLGTSTFVVNGRYSTSVQRIAYPHRVSPADYARLFSLLDYLAASEVAAE